MITSERSGAIGLLYLLSKPAGDKFIQQPNEKCAFEQGIEYLETVCFHTIGDLVKKDGYPQNHQGYFLCDNKYSFVNPANKQTQHEHIENAANRTETSIGFSQRTHIG